MVDVVDIATRSRMMAGIRGRDTKPELIVRSGLFSRGYRYRLHQRGLPGAPDIVLPKYQVVVFVHGCFWHRHDCRFFKWPSTRSDFWRAKICRNVNNDSLNIATLQKNGWRVAVVWECAFKGASAKNRDAAILRLDRWIQGRRQFIEIRGKAT